MRRLLLSAVVSSVLLFAGNAQTPTPGPSDSASRPTVIEPNAENFRPGANTIVLAELPNDLDSRKAKPGDAVEATVLQELIYKGKVIVPRNAKVIGHVLTVKLPTKEDPGSEIGLVFEEIHLPNKKQMPFQNPAIIEAVSAPMKKVAVASTRMADMPVQMERGQSSGGGALDRLANNSNLAGANMPQMQGAVTPSSRGVIDLPGLALDNANRRFSILRAQKGILKLGFESQLVIRVTEDSK